MTTSSPPCIAILGGSFDPVHVAHVAVATAVNHLLQPTQLRIIPSGWSWQKAAFQANAEQRVAMLMLAFAELSEATSLVIDKQEIKRAELGKPSYSVETLSFLRDEFGPSASLVLVIGADQLQQLQSWENWQQLFDLAHIMVVGRPGFTFDATDEMVAKEFKQRAGNIEQLKSSPSGYTYLCADVAIDISSTQIRSGNNLSLLPSEVRHYILQHHLYQN